LPAGVFLAIAVVLFALAPMGTSIDYAVFQRAGERFLRGEALFRPGDGDFAFKYAPIAAAFFAPLSLLPRRVGWLAMNLLSILALMRVLGWTARRMLRPPGLREFAAVLAVAAPYYGHLIWLGQSDGLVLWLLVESEERAERRPLVSGALWALACLVKPPFLVLLLPVLALRNWRRLAGLVWGTCAWLALGAIRYGWTGGLEQLRGWYRMLAGSTPDLVCNPWNQSAFAITCTYLAQPGTWRFGAALVLLALGVTAAGLGGVAVLWRADGTRGRFALGAFALYLGAFLSPLGWNTNLIAALPLACALSSVAVASSVRRLRIAATAAAGAVALLNCLDLLLLPLHLWDDTAMTLLEARQYGIAGLLLAGASLGLLASDRRRAASLEDGLTAQLSAQQGPPPPWSREPPLR
jgi:hypothetical protein